MKYRCAEGEFQRLIKGLKGYINSFKNAFCSSVQELGPCQSVRLKLASSNPAWLWCSPLPSSPPRWSPSRCTTRGWRRLSQDTMLGSTLRTWLSRTCGEGTWPATPSKILHQTSAASRRRLVQFERNLMQMQRCPVLMVSPVFRWSSWTTQGRSKQATLPSSTATLPTWPVALLSWRRSSTGEQARSWRTSRRYWCLETPRQSSWFPSSPCVWRASSHTLP